MRPFRTGERCPGPPGVGEEEEESFIGYDLCDVHHVFGMRRGKNIWRRNGGERGGLVPMRRVGAY